MGKAVAKIVGRALEDGTDVFYLTEEGPSNNYTCVVAAPCLPGDLSSETWSGDFLESKEAAEESAAAQALTVLSKHPEHGTVFKNFAAGRRRALRRRARGRARK